MSEIEAGMRKEKDVEVKEEFLHSGRLPAGDMVSRGLKSIIKDPLYLIVKYMPGPLGYKLREYWYKRSIGSIGKNCLIDPGVNIPTPENIYLSDYVLISEYAQLIAPEGYIKIGRRCHLTQKSLILGHGGVEIGDYVAIAGNIFSVSEWPRHGKRISGPMVPREQRNLLKKKVIIGKDAFIGCGSVIMPGVTVGEGAVVGVNTLVLNDVMPWTVVLGTPAKKIGERDKVDLPDV